MGERTVLVCDLHDGLAQGIVHARIDIDGQVQELDLCEEHTAALREALGMLLPEPQPAATRRTGRRGPGRAVAGRDGRGQSAARRDGRGRRGGRRGGDEALAHSETVRGWAREHGIPVKERGRLSKDVVQAYLAGRQPATAEPESDETL